MSEYLVALYSRYQNKQKAWIDQARTQQSHSNIFNNNKLAAAK